MFGFASAVLRQQNPKPPSAEASIEFIVGHWQVDQAVLGSEGGSFVDYEPDGRFSGKREVFVNGRGVREPVSGTWQFNKLASDRFRLDLVFDNGEKWKGAFRILDHDHIHNLDENYVAVRTPR